MVLRAENGKRTIQYAFTLTLNPRLFSKTPEEQFDATRSAIDSLTFSGARVTAIFELTNSFNVHYHGLVDFEYVKDRNYIKLLHDYFRKLPLLGSQRCIKVVDDYQGWVDYMFKELGRTSADTMRFPIVRDDLQAVPEGRWKLYGIEETCHSLQLSHQPTLLRSMDACMLATTLDLHERVRALQSSYPQFPSHHTGMSECQ